MTTPVILLTIFAGVCALIFTTVRLTHGGITSLLWKTLASFLFVVLGVVAVFQNPHGDIGMYVILGLVCGMLGDILLDLKSVDKTRAESYLNYGMLAFGVGHVFYTVFALLLNSRHDVVVPIVISAVIAVAYTVLVVTFSKQLLGVKLGKFVVQASLYCCALTFTMVLSVALWIANSQMMMFAIAMIAFWFSDMVLSVMYFGGKKDSKVLSVTNHVLYYGAQITIALFMIML